MKITIREKLKPYSHKPGISCLIPGTYAEIEAFPTLLKIAGHEVKLPCTGPVVGFTLELDLERHCVFVFGQAKEGYFKLRVEASDSGFHVTSERGKILEKPIHIKQETIFVPKGAVETLSLGSHKAQDWAKIQTDLKTIVPILFCIGQKSPLLPPQALVGTAKLLELPEDRNALFGALQAFFKAAFTKMLIPRLVDDQHQGFVPSGPVNGNRFFLIQEGAKKLRSLFFQQTDRRLKLLPNLPVPFDCGKMIGVKAPGIGELDFEWSKKVLRCVVLRATTTGEVLFDLQKEIKTFRVDKDEKQKSTEPLLIKAGKTYLLDRFER